MPLFKKAGKQEGMVVRRRTPARTLYAPYTAIKFADVERRANALADRIEAQFEALAHILLEYESYEVVKDEVARALDVLRSLRENEHYFSIRIASVAAFLPRNQPLYALTCFVLIPSFMASEVHFRIPASMRHFMPKLFALLDLYESFPNVLVSHSNRSEFLSERTALRLDPKTKETVPVTDAVIFTGTSSHADQLRLAFDRRTLFITNGSGHNPIIVSKDADLERAVEATLTLTLYNQGQDCAAPNSILVHKDVYPEFIHHLRAGLRTVGVGQYRDRVCRVGPISDPKDLVRIQDVLIRNLDWLDPMHPGIIHARDAILEPTIILKPLKEGGNYTELFSPIIFVQEYEQDADLARYFDDPRYAPNAMYVTVYGTSAYAKSLVGKEFDGKVLHDETTFLENTHLHAKGIERGTQPYGGYGYGASNLSINGAIIPKPTLPQRDIYEWVVKPLETEQPRRTAATINRRFTGLVRRDVQKLMRLKASEAERQERPDAGIAYADLEAIAADGLRYAALPPEHVYRLLPAPNADYIANLDVRDLEPIRALRMLLLGEKELTHDEFKAKLYALPVASEKTKQADQLRFFEHVYQLLFGKSSGPRLPRFLLEADRQQVCALLDA